MQTVLSILLTPFRWIFSLAVRWIHAGLRWIYFRFFNPEYRPTFYFSIFLMIPIAVMLNPNWFSFADAILIFFGIQGLRQWSHHEAYRNGYHVGYKAGEKSVAPASKKG
jgi:hypothetical protein